MKNLIRFMTVIIVLCYFIFIFFHLFKNEEPPRDTWPRPLRSYFSTSKMKISTSGPFRRRKVILVWPADLPAKFFGFPVGTRPFLDHNCPVSFCEMTTDRKRISEADAVIFHPRDLQDYRSRDPRSVIPGYDMPHSHPPQQRWIFYFLESPMYTYLDLGKFKNVFNWTMTYRLDSDIPMPYGWTFEKDCVSRDDCPKQTSDYARNKTGLVAWFVSHCQTHSRRMDYVKELQKFVDVDIYGDCGKKKCPKVLFTGSKPCYQMLKRYKFYLAFENSICLDYLTEKAWTVLSETTAVPVLRGGGDYAQLPPNSYIDANRFSPKELATYLKSLGADDRSYNAFHDWRSHYFVLGNETDSVARSHCQLCAALHDESLSSKWYADLRNFWSKKDCVTDVKIPTSGVSRVRFFLKKPNSPGLLWSFWLFLGIRLSWTL